MVTYVALLRAVNVGGTGKVPMSDLKALCADAGFLGARTYIASGNVVFASKASPAKVKADLEARLLAYVGKPVEVIVRTAAQMAAVLKANPFLKAAPNRTVAIFLDEPPPPDALEHAVGVKDEAMRLGTREIFVHYASGIGKSKLKIPIARRGSARNVSTIAKLTAAKHVSGWTELRGSGDQRCISPEVAQSGHRHRAERCLLSGVKRTSRKSPGISASDPKRKSRV